MVAKRVSGAVTLGLAIILMPSVTVGQQPALDLETREERAFKEASAVVAPSVVRIQTVGGLDRVGRVLTGTAATTGVVVSADGYVISSAFNFVSRPSSVLVTLSDGRRFPAKIVANDLARMLTLLKIQADGLSVPKAAPRNGFRVGQWAIAMGRTYESPLPNLSVGIISALDRIWGRALQTDAKISPVNYGGPLVDIRGQVIGVLVPLSQRQAGRTAGVEWYDSGIGFAIPMVDILGTLPRLKTGTDLLPGLMGITLKLGDAYVSAAIIDRVRFNSPAEKSGLKPGDVIVSVDGQTIRRLVQVRNALGNKYAGDTITVVIRRGEKSHEQKIELTGKLEPYTPTFLGILPARTLRGETANGVKVREVLPESPASQAMIRRGDRVVKLDDTPVTDAPGLFDAISRRRVGDQVAVHVERDGAQQVLSAKLTVVPTQVPVTFGSDPIVAPDPKPADLPKTGQFNQDLAGHGHNFWAYVPENYNPAHGYGLLVWIHEGGNAREADIYEQWKPICDELGLILVGPRAKEITGWNLNEAGFIEALVKEIQQKYHIDDQRIVLHSFSDGCRFAYHLAFKYRSLFRGVVASSQPLTVPPPENRPDLRLQFFLSCGTGDNLHRRVKQTRDRLAAMKFPVTFKSVRDAGHDYPFTELEEIGRWIDMLDRI